MRSASAVVNPLFSRASRSSVSTATIESDTEKADTEETDVEEPARDGNASDRPAAEGGVVEEVPVPAPAPETGDDAPDAEPDTTTNDVPGSGDNE